jgi:hypothetical protein
MNIENVIASMMTENTGTHMLDSGGAYGRHWQRNKGLTVDALKEMPSATLEVSIREWQGKPHAELIPTVNAPRRTNPNREYLSQVDWRRVGDR